jgi:hypothetical protein
MQTYHHSFSNLFEQLGLESSDNAIKSFIEEHARLNNQIELHEADFWNPAQAAFLKQAKDEDADWVELVDQLDSLLRKSI